MIDTDTEKERWMDGLDSCQSYTVTVISIPFYYTYLFCSVLLFFVVALSDHVHYIREVQD